jgi:cobalt/nickel transport system permease protein
MISETFATGSSAIHRLDPRYKIIFATLLSVMVAVSYRFETLAVALVMSVVLVLYARLKISAVGRRLVVIVGFLLLIWLIVPLTYPGELLARWGPFTVTREGIVLCGRVTLKALSILLLLLALIATADFAALGHAMEQLGIPNKIVYLLLMTYRYIFVIEHEYRRLVRAAKIRGFQPGTNIHTYRTFAYFVGMLFVRAVNRADRVYCAMRCRGFKRKFYCLHDFPSSPRNRIFAALMVFQAAVLAALEWTG